MRQRPTSTIALFSLIICCFTWQFQAFKCRAQNSSQSLEQLVSSGQKAFQAKKYAEAQKYFENASKISSKHESLQLWLGTCAAFNHDYRTAAMAMARIIVMCPAKSESANLRTATSMYASYRAYIGNGQPYSGVDEDDNRLMHWSTSRMPLRIYISPGLVLPASFLEKTQTEDIINTHYSWLCQSEFFRRLKRDEDYADSYAQYAINGIEEWSWAKQERIIDYKYVNDPMQADILVFWCPEIAEKTKGRTYRVKVCTPTSKVVIQIRTRSSLNKSLIGQDIAETVAHEFGHTLGLQHSPNSRDVMRAHPDKVIMHADGGVENPPCQVTENDRVTLRALYGLTPDKYY